MRLSPEEIAVIKETVWSFDREAKVYLFGSRVRDQERGGDIDLLIFSDRLTWDEASQIRNRLWEQVGEQQIDIILARDESHPFTRIALRESVLL